MNNVDVFDEMSFFLEFFKQDFMFFSLNYNKILMKLKLAKLMTYLTLNKKFNYSRKTSASIDKPGILRLINSKFIISTDGAQIYNNRRL